MTQFTSQLAKCCFYIGMTIIIIAAIMTIPPRFKRARALEHERDEKMEMINMKNREIMRLKDYQRRFRTDPDFVETIARQNRRVRPGELVFIFEQDKK